MTPTPFLDRTLSELDRVRLARWIRHTEPDSAPLPPMSDLLDAATVVAPRDMPPDVVTMYSQVLVRLLPGDERRRFTLCYPDDAEPAQGFVSVLSPVGAALLGQHVGATACWTTPAGRRVEAEVVAILFQPEASGDYTT